MATLTITVQPEWGRTRLDVDFTSHAAVREAWIYRVVDGVETLLRNAGPAKLSAGLAVIYDTEVPLDRPFHYVMRGYLNRYPWMEEGVDTYTNLTGSVVVVQSQDYVHEGNYSLKMTPNGIAATAAAGAEAVAVSASTSYTLKGWIFTPTNLLPTAGVAIDWYTGAMAFISTSSTTGALYQNEWTERVLVATSPGTAAFAIPRVIMTGTPPANAILYADELRFTATSGMEITTSPSVVSGEGRGWLKDPLHPAVDLPLLVQVDGSPECAPQAAVYFVGIGTTSRRPDSTSYDVPDAELPVTQWSRRKAPTRQLRVFTRTWPDRDQFNALAASGAPILLQLPAEYEEPDRVYAWGETSEDRVAIDHRKPWRVHNVPMAQAHSPAGPSAGVFGTRYQDLDGYETYADAEAASITWQDVLYGQAS